MGAVFFAGFLMYACNNAAVSVAPVLVLDLGGDAVFAGAQGTAYVLAAILMRFWFGPLADRVGEGPVMAAGALAFAVAIPLLAVCESPWQVLGLRIAQAAGLAAFFPSATAAVMRLAPTGRAGACLGWYRTLSSVALAAGPALAFAVAAAAGTGPCLAVLGVCSAAALAAVLAACARGALSRTPGTGALPGTEASGAAGSGPAEPEGPKESKGRSALRRALRCAPRAAPAVLAGSFLAALCYGLQANFLGAHLEAAGMASEASLAFAAVGAGGVVANPVAGRVGDAGRKGAAALVGLGLLGLGTMGLGASPQCAQALLPSCALVGAGYFATVTSALLVLADRMPADARSTAASLQQNAIDAGMCLAGGGFGVLVSYAGGSEPVFVGWGALVCACAAGGWPAFAWLRRTHGR